MFELAPTSQYLLAVRCHRLVGDALELLGSVGVGCARLCFGGFARFLALSLRLECCEAIFQTSGWGS